MSNPEPTVVEVSQITDLDVRIAKEGDSGITIRTGDQVDGRAEFRVLMSDVSGSSGPERQVEGRIVLESSTCPTPRPRRCPATPCATRRCSSTWRAPDANGSPIDRYRSRAAAGSSQECGVDDLRGRPG